MLHERRRGRLTILSILKQTIILVLLALWRITLHIVSAHVLSIATKTVLRIVLSYLTYSMTVVALMLIIADLRIAIPLEVIRAYSSIVLPPLSHCPSIIPVMLLSHFGRKIYHRHPIAVSGRLN